MTWQSRLTLPESPILFTVTIVLQETQPADHLDLLYVPFLMGPPLIDRNFAVPYIPRLIFFALSVCAGKLGSARDPVSDDGAFATLPSSWKPDQTKRGC